ncbi:MAG: YbjN domain-containing protein [Cyanobacteria bacterium]|nr:YbjN domain-containing protein [Cyanobacteriota bacterium]MDW8201410.1 YbjN domain-containing protein [Cyanobacteriota bacterium SKYGB_h_bin112]
MSESYDYIFNSSAVCTDAMTPTEAIYAIGVIAMTIDNDVADEEIEGLEVFLSTTELSLEERRAIRNKIRRLCREAEPGAIFNTAKQALSPSQAETALLLAIKTIQADRTVKAVEGGFVVGLAQALGISEEKFRAIALAASPDTADTEPSNLSNPSNSNPSNNETQLTANLDQVSNHPSLIPVLLQFFTGDEWKTDIQQNEQMIWTTFQGQHGQWRCYAQSLDNSQQVVFYSLCPYVIPSAKQAAITEFVTEANDGLIIGNFELRVDAGELRFKTSMSVEGDRLTPALVKNLVMLNVLTMDCYLPDIAAIVTAS